MKKTQKQPIIKPKVFQKALMAWYEAQKRDLPWRSSPSLYKTVVSEFMLQQTQVVTVLPYFERWLKAFPDFLALAKADEEVVLKHWEGLGYYTRARNLHRLAKALVQMKNHPQTPQEWQMLPGVGPYTAAAIASIAQNYPIAVVDGNVVRVISRLLADKSVFSSLAQAHGVLEPHAQALLNKELPGDHNQAMMELGAKVCTKKNPDCLDCPVRLCCVGLSQGIVETLPRLIRKPSKKVLVNRGVIIKEGALLLHKRGPAERRLPNVHELPSLELLEIGVPSALPLMVKKRGIALEIIEERFYTLAASEIEKRTHLDLFWVKIDDLDAITLSGPHRKWIKDILRDT